MTSTDESPHSILTPDTFMKNLLCASTAILLLAGVLSAQTGKPLYTISVARGGEALGTIDIEMFPDIAPKHVANFDSLVRIMFYDGTAFHRVVPGFVIQGGDPNSRSGSEDTWGYGDPSQTPVSAEFSTLHHVRGILSAARATDPNSATSQFFVCVATASHLDLKYSIYGRVLRGMDIVDTIVMSPVVGGTQRPQQKIAMTIVRTGTDTTTPTAPLLVAPGNDTTRVNTSILAKWDSVPGAILYQVQLSTSPEFASLLYNDSLTSTTATLRNLVLGPRRYYWRVRASNGGRRGPWSDVFAFSTLMPAPALVSPPNGDTSTARPAPLVWNGVAGATAYRLEVATSLAFTEILQTKENLQDTTYLLDSLNPDTRYYWRVTPSDGSIDGLSSARWNFKTAYVSSVDRISDDALLSDYAVMVDGQEVVVQITLSRSAIARLTIIDETGREAVTWTETVEGGNTTHRFDARNLRSGLYFCRLNIGDVVVIRRFVVAR